MMSLKRCFVATVVGMTLLAGLSSCVVAPAAPGPSGYVVSPPVVVIRPYRPYRYYHRYRYYRPYRPYYGWSPHADRW